MHRRIIQSTQEDVFFTKFIHTRSYLVSPHLYFQSLLPPDPLYTDSIYVKGLYLYYHYGCDEFNDKVYYFFFYSIHKGWGCAYRSLQSIYSWYLLNGYKSTLSSSSIPTHYEVFLLEAFILSSFKRCWSKWVTRIFPFINLMVGLVAK